MEIEGILFEAELYDILQELKSQLAANGVELLHKIKKGNEDIMVSCPYHKHGQERRPSAGIRTSDGLFHCFACEETHTLAEVVSHCFGYNDLGMFGWRWLLQNFATVTIQSRKDITVDYSRDVSVKRDNFVSEQELDSYRYIHPYMYKRKLTDEIIELFDIGYDKSTDCITFPIRNEQGNTLFLARRSVKTKFFNYPEGAEKPLYGLYELSQLSEYPKEIIVCESMLDALAAWSYGSYAVALNGLGNDLQYKQLRRLPCRKLILATDNDAAGMRARNRLRTHIGSTHLISEYIFPDGKKDLNDLSLEEFKNLLEIF